MTPAMHPGSQQFGHLRVDAPGDHHPDTTVQTLTNEIVP